MAAGCGSSYFCRRGHEEGKLVSNGPHFQTLSHDLHPFSARTRELPNNYPYIVKKQYIGNIVKQWKKPSRQLFDIAVKELIKHVKLEIERNFSQYTYGQLKQRVTYALPFFFQVPFVYD